MTFSAAALKTKARDLGFNMIGVTTAAPSPTLAAYERWLDAGMHGTMTYMARPDRQARRRDLNAILPGARALVVVGVDYRAALPEAILADPSRGRIAAYAWGLDYHDILTPRLEAFARWLIAESGQNGTYKVYIDTGALLERSHGQQAGLGFIGKNTMLIHPRRGSYFFLGEIITDLEFDAYDTPSLATMCGRCTRCLTACPTDAFPQPYVLDARRCISYLTIEHKGWIDRDLRPKMGNWVFGCDVCQDVCPWQRFAPGNVVGEHRTTPALSLPNTGFVGTMPASSAHRIGCADSAPTDIDRAAPPLLDLLALDEPNFRARFDGTPVARIGRDRLVRNACVAAGNWGHADAVPALIRLLDDASPLVRGHAAWALRRVMGDAAPPIVESEE